MLMEAALSITRNFLLLATHAVRRNCSTCFCLHFGRTCLVHRCCAQAATLDRKHYMEDRWSFKRLCMMSVLFVAHGFRKTHAGKPSVFSIAMVMEQSAKKSHRLSLSACDAVKTHA